MLISSPFPFSETTKEDGGTNTDDIAIKSEKGLPLGEPSDAPRHPLPVPLGHGIRAGDEANNERRLRRTRARLPVTSISSRSVLMAVENGECICGETPEE